MPTPSDRAPSQFTPFAGEEEHLRAHRALDAAVIGLDGSTANSTTSAISGVFTQVAVGGQTPVTSSTAAPVRGVFRTAAPFAIAVPAMTALGITTIATVATFSVEGKIGNPVTVGDTVILVPVTALPTNTLLGGVSVSDTNTIQATFIARTAATVTATFTVHIYSVDLA